jgi:hypothetical protein
MGGKKKKREIQLESEIVEHRKREKSKRQNSRKR